MLNIDQHRESEGCNLKDGANSCRKNCFWDEMKGNEKGKQLGLHIRGQSILDCPEKELYWKATKIIVLRTR